MSACLNCNAELHGRYCHDCGQKATAPVVELHDFVHEATHEFLHLDGKILNTVKLLVLKPGQLTKEFIEGRRARHISPIRLYLTFSVMFFALAALLPGARESFIKVKADDVAQAENERLAEELMHNMPRAAFAVMPAFALLTWLFYRREQRYFIPHLYYSIHFHTFAFLWLTVALLFGTAGEIGRGIGAVIFFAVFPYHYIGLRRVFGGSRWKTFAKGTAVGILYWIMLAATMAGLAWLTFRMH